MRYAALTFLIGTVYSLGAWESAIAFAEAYGDSDSDDISKYEN